MPDLPDWSQSVSIDAANVTITVSGSVTIASGSVTIANASIAVINATGTKITSARPAKFLGEVLDSPNPNTANFSLDSDVQALVVTIPYPLAQLVHFKIAWHPISGGALQWIPLELFSFTQNVFAFPILPSQVDQGGNTTTSIDVTFQGTSVGGQAVFIYELFEAAPLWLQVFPLPQLEPNQFPLMAGIDLGGAALVQFGSQWLISPVANVQITLFDIIQGFAQQGAAPMAYMIGHGTSLPSGVANPPMASRICIGSDAAAISHDFLFALNGAQLPRGDGLWLQNPQAANLQVALFTISYSLS